ncbi:MAG TPA: AAA family ATPase, partial [Herpetosiphonaceae bacterium]|nr:AAA family ATPase [Herpetosiphonaceae bacterium]
MIQEPVLSQTHHLPVALTPFVGREGETAQLIAQLGDPACRLVTIMGPGGAGKTRLALEVAQRLLPTNNHSSPFAMGVYFVPLGALASDEHLDGLLATAIAGAMGMPLSGPDAPVVQLCHYLREKAVLLVLDNFEHLQGGASFVVTLLQAAGHVKILTTSRERLNVRGEYVLLLNGLSYPAAPDRPASLDEHSAVQLFVRTAQAVDPDFAPTDESLPAITRICRLLDGLPLGIELAAPWTRLLSCAEIADEIERNLDFLAPAPHDLPARQQSLRAVFASSWSLLTAAEQQLLGRLAIFRGSFSREAAAAVAGASLPVLAALVDKSLVRRLTTGSDGAARYELSHVVRRYAAEQPAAGDATISARHHAAYYLALLYDLTTNLRGPRQQDALRVISFEIDEIRAAWRWAATAGDTMAITRAADSLFHFYDMRSWFAEGAAAFGLAS